MSVELVTDRLILRETPVAEARALVDGRRDGGLPSVEDYPHEGSLVAAAMVVRAAEEGEAEPSRFQFQIVRREDSRVIGDIGFLGAPDPDGALQVDFGLAPSARGYGYAREAVNELVRWALMQPGVHCVTAETESINVASCAVLERAGMRLVRDEDGRRHYRAP